MFVLSGGARTDLNKRKDDLTMKRFLALFILLVVVVISSAIVSPVRSTHAVGGVWYADFTGGEAGSETGAVSGRVTFTEIPGGICRHTAQFNTGFESADVDDYTFIIVDDNNKLLLDLTNNYREIHINVPGTSPIQIDFNSSVVCGDVAGAFFVIKNKGEVIGKTAIQAA